MKQVFLVMAIFAAIGGTIAALTPTSTTAFSPITLNCTADPHDLDAPTANPHDGTERGNPHDINHREHDGCPGAQ